MVVDDFRKAVANAVHLKALGHTEVHLYGYEAPLENYPWHLATKCEEGGSHRLDMATSVRFTGYHAKSGLTFSWSFDIEDRSANGKGYYEIDTDQCRQVMQLLGDSEAGKQFKDYLKEGAKKVRAKGVEWQKYADRQFGDAARLEALARSS